MKKFLDDKDRHLKEIDIFKNLMVGELCKINAPANVYFSFGAWINCIADHAFSLGELQTKMLHDIKE